MEDLSNKIYGFWTVLEKGEKENGCHTWICKCQCGNIRNVRERHLKIGKSTSCNCGLSRRMNMAGIVKNSWTVIGLDKTRSNNGHGFWICKCLCGYEKSIHGGDIRRGKALRWCSCKKSKNKKNNDVFDKNYEISNSGCWEWKGKKCPKGYGYFGGRNKAHRYSYERFVGPLEKGLIVCHDCDNPGCVNPDHLWIGSPKSNSLDMVLKGRSAKGENHSQSKLTQEQVTRIRNLSREGKTNIWISKKFGVNKKTISSIVNYKTWKVLF